MSARALGAMGKGLRGEKFDELMGWLMDTVKSEASSVDRSGAAQGKFVRVINNVLEMNPDTE